jgi:hypothetical protein
VVQHIKHQSRPPDVLSRHCSHTSLNTCVVVHQQLPLFFSPYVPTLSNMARENLTYYLAERPNGDIVPGKTFEAKTAPAPTADPLKDGQVLVESLYLSLDPAMRGWLNGMTTPHAVETQRKSNKR